MPPPRQENRVLRGHSSKGPFPCWRPDPWVGQSARDGTHQASAVPPPPQDTIWTRAPGPGRRPSHRLTPAPGAQSRVALGPRGPDGTRAQGAGGSVAGGQTGPPRAGTDHRLRAPPFPRGPRATPRAASPGRARDTTTWTWAGKGTWCAGRTSAHCRVTCDGSRTKTHTVHEPGGAPSKGTVHSSGAGGRGHKEALGGGHLRSGQNHQMGRAEYVHLNMGEKRGRNFQKCWWAVGWGKGSPPSAALATHPHVTLGTVLPIQ